MRGGKTHPHPSALREHVCDLYESGVRPKWIAAWLGLPSSTVRVIAFREGLTRPDRDEWNDL